MSDRILETLGRIDERSARTEAAVQRIGAAIYGNGHPGLIRRLDDATRRIELVERSHRELRDRESRQRAARSRFLWAILTALTIAVATDVYKLALSHARTDDSKHRDSANGGDD